MRAMPRRRRPVNLHLEVAQPRAAPMAFLDLSNFPGIRSQSVCLGSVCRPLSPSMVPREGLIREPCCVALAGQI